MRFEWINNRNLYESTYHFEIITLICVILNSVFGGIDGDGLSAFILYTSYAQYCNEIDTDTAICLIWPKYQRLQKIREWPYEFRLIDDLLIFIYHLPLSCIQRQNAVKWAIIEITASCLAFENVVSYSVSPCIRVKLIGIPWMVCGCTVHSMHTDLRNFNILQILHSIHHLVVHLPIQHRKSSRTESFPMDP